MFKAKTLLLALALIVGVAILLVVTSPREPTSSQQTQAQKVNLRGYDEEGFLTWSLEALEGEIKDDTGKLADVEAVFFEEGTARLQATADALTFAGKEATLSGGVEVLHDDYRLETKTLVWFESERMLTAGEVTILFEAASVEAEAFSYNLDTEQALLEGGVTSTLDRAAHMWQVSAQRAEAKNGRLILTGEVSVKSGDESYQCASLEYDRKRDEVSLSGGVEGGFDSGTIHADSIRLASDGIVASGGVTLLLEDPFFREADDA